MEDNLPIIYTQRIRIHLLKKQGSLETLLYPILT
jgi:hypothetical protein